jgi:hypothetical protein
MPKKAQASGKADPSINTCRRDFAKAPPAALRIAMN